MNSRGAVFLSYASQDAEVARTICEALRETGIEVWFDQSELRGGDAWDARIRRNIKDCALFVPIISRHTQERAEGYFRLEWHLAEQRTFLMASDEPFLAPVIVDDVSEQDARVPDRFRERQWTRISGKPATAAFAQRIAGLLAGDQMGAPKSPPAAARAPAAPRRGRRVAIAASLAAGLAVAAAALWLRSAKPGSPGPAPSPADALIARATATINGPSGAAPSKEALDTAEGLLEQAKAMDPNNGEVWSGEALNDLLYISSAVDGSAERRSRATSEVDRAMVLAPHSFDARLAHALELTYVMDPSVSSSEAESELKRLIREAPGRKDIKLTLGFVLRTEGHNKEAAAVLMQAGSPAQASWEYLHIGDWRRMDAAADLALKVDPSDVDPKLHAELFGFEDAAAARRILDGLPPQEMLKEYPVSIQLFFRYMLRDPQKMLEITRSFPREWISCWYFLEPKAAWEGNAYRLMGQLEAAKAKWQFALKEIDERLASAPDDAHLILLKSDMNSALGHNDEAAAGIHLYEQLSPGDQKPFVIDHLRLIGVRLRLGQRAEVMRTLDKTLHNPVADQFSLHGEARFYPDLDPLRSDPSFQKLMRETKPYVAKPLD